MSHVVAAANTTLRRAGSAFYRLIRGSKPIPKRWTPTYFINMVSVMVLVGIVTAEIVFGLFRIGFTPSIKCIEGEVFLVSRIAPETLEVGKLYAFSGNGYGAEYGIDFGQDAVITKYLAAVPGDKVLVDAGGISINGAWWGGLNPETLSKMSIGIDDVAREYVVSDGQVLMLGTLARSIDGRYMGTVSTNTVIGRAWRLW